jgi:Domain of unknown function (DUF4266)
MKRALALVVAAAALAAATGGCARVKPYQREHLSQRMMIPGGEYAEDNFRAHWQSSREGSEGGFGAAGGGCGCN